MGARHPAGRPAHDDQQTPFEKHELPRVIGDHEIAIDDHSYMPTDLVRQCKRLKHIVFLGTGAASYMNVAELEAAGVKVHTIKGYGDTAVAEQTIALMMAACRDLARMDRNISAGTWQPLEGVQVYGKTLGIIGLGGIGAEVARIAKGMGMEVDCLESHQASGRGGPYGRARRHCWSNPTSSRSISCSTTRLAAFSTRPASRG